VLAFWLLHGVEPAVPTRTQARAALLPEVRRRGCRPAHLRGLLCDHLQALRDAARISRRTRDRIIHGDARTGAGARNR